jgi:hypothetical protein
MLEVWAERHPTAATAAVCGGFGDGAQCQAKKRRRTPLGVLGSRSRWLAGRENEQAGELNGRAAMAASGSVWRPESGDGGVLIGEASSVTSP